MQRRGTSNAPRQFALRHDSAKQHLSQVSRVWKVPEKACLSRVMAKDGEQAENGQSAYSAGISDGQAPRFYRPGKPDTRAARGICTYAFAWKQIRAFERMDDDIRSSVTISVVDAILGTVLMFQRSMARCRSLFRLEHSRIKFCA